MIERMCVWRRRPELRWLIQHISTKEGVALVREAKRRGADVHAEATPHHFTLTEDAVIQYGSLAKMNPPLREEADRQAIIEGLQDNTIDMIATDHAPHTAREKEKPLTEAQRNYRAGNLSFLRDHESGGHRKADFASAAGTDVPGARQALSSGCRISGRRRPCGSHSF